MQVSLSPHTSFILVDAMVDNDIHFNFLISGAMFQVSTGFINFSHGKNKTLFFAVHFLLFT